MSGSAQAQPTRTQFSGDHGALSGLMDDDHLIYALLAGRAGGQTLIGGTLASENLDLQANVPNSGTGRVRSLTGFEIDGALENGAAASIIARDTPTLGAFVGGVMQSLGTVTYTVTTFIWALLQESKIYRADVNPGFAAFTLFNAINTIENEGNFNLVQAIILNVGTVHRRRTSGTSTTSQTLGLSFSPQTAASVSGAVMTRTVGMTAVRVSPTMNTVAGSTINLGTIIGMDFADPAVALFGSLAGTENITAYLCMNVPALTFGGANRVIEVIRSALNAATNVRFLNHTGTAESTHVGNFNMLADFPNGILRQGLSGSSDYSQGWVATNEWFQQISSPATSQLRHGSPAADRWTIRHALDGGELNFGMDRMSFGSIGAVGNQAFTYQQNARTVTIAGGYGSVLFTAAANLNLGVLAMSDVSAWVVNALSFDNSAYSISELATFRVGGMTTSNPGGTVTSRAAFWSTGRFLQRGTGSVGAGNSVRRWARISGDAVTSVLTGIDSTAVQDGDTFELTNVSANSIDITNEDAASAAANRIITGTGGTIVLAANDTVTIRYDATTARWRVLERV